MTEDEVRAIVRDELDQLRRESAVRNRAALDQFEAGLRETTKPDPEDGPTTTRIKAILRGEDDPGRA